MSVFLPAPAHVTLAGHEVSPIAWGMWRFAGADLATARARIDAAFEAGVTLFDTADIYGCDTPGGFGSAEALLGDVFAEAPALRDKMVLATKGGIILGVPYDSSAAYLTSAIDISLQRLRTDRVELWQIHRPDLLAHPQEIARTLEDAHRAGKIGAIGVSNFTTAQTAALAKFLPVPVVSHQSEFSPLKLDPLFDGLFDQTMMDGMSFLAWSPLGGGRRPHVRSQLVLGALRRRLRVPGRARSQAKVELGALPRHRPAGRQRRVRQYPAAVRL
jgi:aryl-alcohol dehydrogenase-like predicted oxidoreductase